MDPAQPSALRELLRRHAIHPRKRLGQHFLCDGNVLDRIADLAVGAEGTPVLEIGAGLGALTVRLARHSSSVLAVEVDSTLIPALQETLSGLPHVRLLHADFLKLPLQATLEEVFQGRKGCVAGNIPYGITAPILERIFSGKHLLRRAVLLVQAEVADRLTAAPETRDYSALTVFAAYHGRIRKVLDVGRHLFYPPPEVGSTLVIFEPGSDLEATVRDPARFFAIVRAAFAQRRKTLPNALAGAKLAASSHEAARWLEACGVSPARRGETLAPAEFAAVANYLSEPGSA